LLESFSSSGFRNLESEPFALARGITLLYGDNGAGKTNFLEALAVLSGRPSFRAARSSEMARGDSFTVRGRARGPAGPEELSVAWQAGRARRFARGSRAVPFTAMAEVFPAVFLVPEDRDLVIGSPSARRRFLDRMAVTLFPAAAADFRRFHKALEQRNAQITTGVEGDALESWTEEFLECCAAVARRRRDALALWKPAFVELCGGPSGLPELEVSYRGGPGEAGDAVGHYRAEAASCRRAELARGHTLFGPQRDDLEMSRGGRAFAASASGGEILRAAFLARIAEGRAALRAGGHAPLFTVDDFDSELSPRSAEALLSELPEDGQLVLTTTRPEAAAACPRRPEALYEVEAGRARLRPERENMRRIG
jgi:DNA replication and repair protein RecF